MKLLSAWEGFSLLLLFGLTMFSIVHSASKRDESSEDFYCIGAKGAWMDDRVMEFFPQFVKEAKQKKIQYFHLFDHEVKASGHDIVKYVGKSFKFFPEGYTAPASVDIFGDRVNIISDIHLGGVSKDMTFTVIVNQQIADAFRLWFQFMWDSIPDSASMS